MHTACNFEKFCMKSEQVTLPIENVKCVGRNEPEINYVMTENTSYHYAHIPTSIVLMS